MLQSQYLQGENNYKCRRHVISVIRQGNTQTNAVGMIPIPAHEKCILHHNPPQIYPETIDTPPKMFAFCDVPFDFRYTLSHPAIAICV